MLRACVVMVAVLGTGATASTQDGAEPVEREVVPAEENAALRYWEAWYGLYGHMRELGGATYTPDGIDVFVSFESTREAEVAKVERLLKSLELYGIDKLIEASKIEHCDFQRDFVEPELGDTPHLNAAEQSAHLLAADAGRLLASDQPEEALERLATIFSNGGAHWARGRYLRESIQYRDLRDRV